MATINAAVSSPGDRNSILTGVGVMLRSPKPGDVADRLALGFDPDILQLFGGDPKASEMIPALAPLTEDAVERCSPLISPSWQHRSSQRTQIVRHVAELPDHGGCR